MKQAGHLLNITILSVSALLATTAKVDAAPYSFSLDSFSMTGNMPGSFSDDFNGSSLGADWEEYDPTVEVTGGQVVLHNPGTLGGATLGSINISSQMSYIGSQYPLVMEDGKGDFSGTSTWAATIPGMNQFFGMHVSIDGTDEDIGVGIYNFSSDVAGFFGTAPGLAVFVMRVNDVSVGDFALQSYSIDPADITGSILMRLSFDDDNNMFTGEFSLNGSGSYLSPFLAVVPTSLGTGLTWSLGGESWDVTPVPIPGTIWLLGSAILPFWRLWRSRCAIAD